MAHLRCPIERQALTAPHGIRSKRELVRQQVSASKEERGQSLELGLSKYKGRAMSDEKFNMSMRKFLKQVGVTSQQQLEALARSDGVAGSGKMKVKVVLTAAGTDLNHVVEGEIDLD